MFSFLFTQTPLKFFIQSFWRDEAFSYLVAKQPLVDIIKITAKDFNPPFYYFILHGWMKVFGTSEIALRSLSLLFFMATLYVVFLLLTHWLKVKNGSAFLYLILFAANPLLLYYAFEARMYTLFAFLSTLSFYFFVTKNRKAHIITSLLGLYTHYFMIFVLLVQLIYHLTTKRTKEEGSRIFADFFKIGVVFAPWALFFLSQKPPIDKQFWIPPINLKTILHAPAILFTGYEYGFGFYEKFLSGLSLFIFTIIGISIFCRKKHRLIFLWVFIPALFIILISFFKPIFIPRYQIFITIGLIFLIASTLEQLPLFFKYGLFTVILLYTMQYNSIQIKYREKSDIRKAIHEIKTLAKQNDLLFVTSELDFHTAEYYFDEKRVFIYGKDYQDIPFFVGTLLIPQDKVTHILPSYPQKAFILNSNLSYEVKAIY